MHTGALRLHPTHFQQSVLRCRLHISSDGGIAAVLLAGFFFIAENIANPGEVEDDHHDLQEQGGGCLTIAYATASKIRFQDQKCH